ncbi:MAG: hypothetical protein IAE96_06555 [Chitinophagaceae bacterium]|nr:hypothetical protein [Chitinophagaceae bacterium]
MKKNSENYPRMVQVLFILLVTELIFLFVRKGGKPLIDTQVLLGIVGVTFIVMFYFFIRFIIDNWKAGRDYL